MHRLRSRPGPAVTVAVAAAVLAAALAPATPGAAVSAPRSTYVVELAAEPLAAYHGGLTAYAATSPEATGEKLDVDSDPALRYTAFLDGRQERALRRAAVPPERVIYRYRNALAGFAAELTALEAARLRAAPGVRAVTPDTVSHPAAAPNPDPHPVLGRDGAAFLDLPDGLWERLGGPHRAGEGMVIGVIDTGIFPEHPSFADEPEGDDGPRYDGPAYDPPAEWRGVCQAGEAFPETTCNDKLVGARWFVEGFGVENVHDDEFLSARDASGHGSHTAATAAGNYGVDPRIAGHDLGVPFVSGIAPRAHVAAYKVCWTGRSDAGREVDDSCTGSDTVAAVDAAVADGVDVINYSVGSSSPSVFGPAERAFLFAVDAGVFVAASAGNDGPEAGSVGSPTAIPWVTSVAASTLARDFEAPVTVRPPDGAGGTPVEATGASLGGGLPPTLLVDSADVAAPGRSAADAELCFPGALDRARVAGRVVLCRRGVSARVEKGQVVRDAGGAGMILYNAAADEELVADVHVLPAAHVTMDDGLAMKALLARASGVEAELGGGRAVAGRGDVLASFSSRGPQLAVPDVPKPDVTAPGVEILAAESPTPAGPGRRGERFQVLSGTSMSAPHVAGAAALLAQRHPAWSPAAIKSALMTTADPEVLREDEETPADPFDTGSGRIDPNRADDPGLVLDAGAADYARYLEGQDPTLVVGDVAPLRPADLNLPAVAFGAFTAADATTRTFTSVAAAPAAWTTTVEGLPGVDVAVTPSAFDVAPGASQAVELRFTRSDAAYDAYSFGAVVLRDGGGRTVRLPVSIRPARIAAPAVVEAVTGEASGSVPVELRTGYAGQVSGLGWGLAPPRVAAGETIGFGKDAPPYAPGPGVRVYDVHVPPGAQILAGEIANADGGAPDTDLDLFLFHDDEGDGFDGDDLVAMSADADADEAVTVPQPPPGPYRFGILGFKISEPASTYDFTTWVGADPSPDDPSTPSTAPGLVVTGDPAPARPAETTTLTLAWSGLTTDGVHLGLLTFSDAASPDPRAPVARSVVRVVKDSRATGTTAAPVPARGGRAGPMRPALR